MSASLSPPKETPVAAPSDAAPQANTTTQPQAAKDQQSKQENNKGDSKKGGSNKKKKNNNKNKQHQQQAASNNNNNNANKDGQQKQTQSQPRSNSRQHQKPHSQHFHHNSSAAGNQSSHQHHHGPRNHHHRGHHNGTPSFPPAPPVDEAKEQALDAFFYNHAYRLRVIKNKTDKKDSNNAFLQKYIDNVKNGNFAEAQVPIAVAQPQQHNKSAVSAQTQQMLVETEDEKKARADMYQTILTGETFQLPEKYEIICTDNAYQVDWWIATHILKQVASAPEKVVIVGMDCEWDMLRPNLDISVIMQTTAANKPAASEGAPAATNNAEQQEQKDAAKQQPANIVSGYQGYNLSTFPDTIQIATENACLIYQCGAMPPSANLIMMLLNNRVLKIWCNYDQDVEKLDNWFQNYNALNFKLGSYAQALGFCDVDSQHVGAYQLCAKSLSKRLEKDWSIIFSRWSRRKLDEKQQMYAALDAYLNFCIFKKK